jgi:hypothetical protein
MMYDEPLLNHNANDCDQLPFPEHSAREPDELVIERRYISRLSGSTWSLEHRFDLCDSAHLSCERRANLRGWWKA